MLNTQKLDMLNLMRCVSNCCQKEHNLSLIIILMLKYTV